MNGDLGKLKVAVPAEALVYRPLSLAACNQLHAMLGEPLRTATGYAAYAVRPPLAPACRQLLLSHLFDGLRTR